MDKINAYFTQRNAEEKSTFILKGGRRSGKTWHILTYLAARCILYPYHTVSVASMTQEQGRLGAYSDMLRILDLYPVFGALADPKSSPLEIRFPSKRSRMVFKSYGNSETAKGIVCNDLFINEANNFSFQQYTDLRANVRDLTFLDFNPNIRFWVDDIFEPSDICTTTWRDNEAHLTPAQLEYFATLKKLAERPEATSVDKALYSIYYLGEYADIDGAVFTRANMHLADALPRRADGSLALRNFATFSDPSALRGADYFASCLTATDDDGNVWVVDTDSRNTGGREDVARVLLQWCREWDVARCYVETNGVVGLDFYDFAANSGIPVEGWYSKGNKYQRIVDNYQNLTSKLFILDTERNRKYLEQVYAFAEKCEHDDNADALNSSFNMQRWTA